MFELEGKVIVVTGGSRGIGKATVKLLMELGAKVASINLNDSAKNADLNIIANVTSEEQMEHAFKEVEDKLGSIYGIVCNAGITKDGFFHKTTKENWDEVIDVNLKGAYNSVKPTINKLYQQKEGSIVFVSSVVGENGNMGQTNYSASKAALIGFAKSLAKEAARNGVRSNVVAPGFTDTSMTEFLPEKVVNNLYSQTPFGRFAKPEEIGWTIVFLLSPKLSSYITGEVIRVNGGLLM